MPTSGPTARAEGLDRLGRAAGDEGVPVALGKAAADHEARPVGRDDAVDLDGDVGLAGGEALGLHLLADPGEILVGPHRRRAADVGIAHAVGAAMRPVDRNAVAQLAAEQLIDRHAQRLALDVEQRVLDGGDGLADDAAARLGRSGGEHGVDQLDLHRVHADHVGHQRLDHARQAGAAEAFVVFRPADDAVGRHELEKREGPPSRVALEDFESLDLHRFPRSCVRWREIETCRARSEPSSAAETYRALVSAGSFLPDDFSRKTNLRL